MEDMNKFLQNLDIWLGDLTCWLGWHWWELKSTYKGYYNEPDKEIYKCKFCPKTKIKEL